MKLSYFILTLLFVHLSHAKPKVDDFDLKIQKHLKQMSSINNVEIYLNGLRPKLTYNQKAEFQKVLSKSKNKMYQSRMTSKNSFELKLSSGVWAKFTFDREKNALLVGKSPYKWNFKDSIEANVNKMSVLINNEFGRKKTALFNYMIPEANAQEEGLAEEIKNSVVTTTSALAFQFTSSDMYFSNADDFCSGKPSFMTNLGNPEEVRAHFKEQKEIILHGWFNLQRQHDKFARVQYCLAHTPISKEKKDQNNYYIKTSEMLTMEEVQPSDDVKISW